MIERVAECIDFVATKHPQPPLSLTRSRRILHHNFWDQSQSSSHSQLTFRLLLQLKQNSEQRIVSKHSATFSHFDNSHSSRKDTSILRVENLVPWQLLGHLSKQSHSSHRRALILATDPSLARDGAIKSTTTRRVVSSLGHSNSSGEEPPTAGKSNGQRSRMDDKILHSEEGRRKADRHAKSHAKQPQSNIKSEQQNLRSLKQENSTVKESSTAERPSMAQGPSTVGASTAKGGFKEFDEQQPKRDGKALRRKARNGDIEPEVYIDALEDDSDRPFFDFGDANGDVLNEIQQIQNSADPQFADSFATGPEFSGILEKRPAEVGGMDWRLLNENHLNTAPHTDRIEKFLAHPGRYPRYKRIWKLFNKLQDKKMFASRVLACLSRSDLYTSRALKVYNFIEIDVRTDEDYENAVRATLRSEDGGEDEIFNEAMARECAIPCSRLLLTHRLLHWQWEGAAQLWRRLSDSCAPNMLRRHSFWENIEGHKSFVPCIILYANYVRESRSVSDPQDSPLMDLAYTLADRVFSSRSALMDVTVKGLNSVVDAFNHLGLLKPSHLFSGLSTIKAFQTSNHRSQLALLLYQKYREAFGHHTCPRVVLGSMLAILTDSENASVEDVQNILDDFSRTYGHPDEHAYQAAMTAYARMGEAQRVQELLDQYCVHYGKPQELAFLTPSLYAHAMVGDVKQTRRQFDLISQNYGIRPSLYCWNILLVACQRARDVEGAFSVFAEMQECQVVPNNISFTTLMSLCANAGDIDAIHKLVSLARQRGIKGDTAMINTLVESYCSNDNPLGAKILLEEASRIHTNAHMIRGWNILLRHYAFKVNTKAVVETQSRMQELGVSPDAMTYAALMQSLALIGRTFDAAKVFASLYSSRRIDASLFHYTILLNGFLQEGNRNMVDVVCQEIADRFPRQSYGVKLAKLQSLVMRGIGNAHSKESLFRKLDVSNAESFLFDLLRHPDPRDLATKSPEPGALSRRTGAVASFPAAYFRAVTNAFSQHGPIAKFEKFFDLYQSVASLNTNDASPKTSRISLELNTERMNALLRQEKFAEITECWNQSVAMAISLGRPIDNEITQQATGSRLRNGSSVVPPLPFYSDGDAHIDASRTQKASDPLYEPGLKILPAQRFLLAKPLQVYMLALALQKRTTELIEMISKLENVGFALSSRNYNYYIQLLARTEEVEHQLFAVELFDARLADHLSAFSASRAAVRQRQMIAKFDLGNYVPEYRTVKLLGLIMRAFQAKIPYDGGLAWRRFARRAAKTVRFLTVSLRYKASPMVHESLAKGLWIPVRYHRRRSRALQTFMKSVLDRRKNPVVPMSSFRRGQYVQRPLGSILKPGTKDTWPVRSILGESSAEEHATTGSIAAAKHANLELATDDRSIMATIEEAADRFRHSIPQDRRTSHPDAVSFSRTRVWRMHRKALKKVKGFPSRRAEKSFVYHTRRRTSPLLRTAVFHFRLTKHIRSQKSKATAQASLAYRVRGQPGEGVVIGQKKR